MRDPYYGANTISFDYKGCRVEALVVGHVVEGQKSGDVETITLRVLYRYASPVAKRRPLTKNEEQL